MDGARRIEPITRPPVASWPTSGVNEVAKPVKTATIDIPKLR
jgi:hypothetical protein